MSYAAAYEQYNVKSFIKKASRTLEPVPTIIQRINTDKEFAKSFSALGVSFCKSASNIVKMAKFVGADEDMTRKLLVKNAINTFGFVGNFVKKAEWWEYLIPGYNTYAAGRDAVEWGKGKAKGMAMEEISKKLAEQFGLPEGFDVNSPDAFSQILSSEKGKQIIVSKLPEMLKDPKAGEMIGEALKNPEVLNTLKQNPAVQAMITEQMKSMDISKLPPDQLAKMVGGLSKDQIKEIWAKMTPEQKSGIGEALGAKIDPNTGEVDFMGTMASKIPEGMRPITDPILNGGKFWPALMQQFKTDPGGAFMKVLPFLGVAGGLVGGIGSLFGGSGMGGILSLLAIGGGLLMAYNQATGKPTPEGHTVSEAAKASAQQKLGEEVAKNKAAEAEQQQRTGQTVDPALPEARKQDTQPAPKMQDTPDNIGPADVTTVPVASPTAPASEQRIPSAQDAQAAPKAPAVATKGVAPTPNAPATAAPKPAPEAPAVQAIRPGATAEVQPDPNTVQFPGEPTVAAPAAANAAPATVNAPQSQFTVRPSTTDKVMNQYMPFEQATQDGTNVAKNTATNSATGIPINPSAPAMQQPVQQTATAPTPGVKAPASAPRVAPAPASNVAANTAQNSMTGISINPSSSFMSPGQYNQQAKPAMPQKPTASPTPTKDSTNMFTPGLVGKVQKAFPLSGAGTQSVNAGKGPRVGDALKGISNINKNRLAPGTL